MSKYAVISYSGYLSHDNYVRDGIVSGYDGEISADDIQIESAGNGYPYAATHCIEIWVKSTTGISGFQTAAKEYYEKYGILSVMPLGSNIYEELDSLSSIPECIVSTGAGVESNQTGYGNGLEFWDTENIAEDVQQSSYANGVIAGKLLKIKHESGKGWNSVRGAARETASGGGVWNKYNGYGKINVSAAIEYLARQPNAVIAPSVATPEEAQPEDIDARSISTGATYHKLKGWKVGRTYQL
jgi:hypothetical protein